MAKKFVLVEGVSEEDAVFEEEEEVPSRVTIRSTIQGKLALIEMYKNEIKRLQSEIEQMRAVLKEAKG